MCGIHAVLSSQTPTSSASHPQDHGLPAELKRCLHARGPDHFGQVERAIHASDDGTSLWSLRLTSSVLALRGGHVARQPLVDPGSDSVLCWNGEAWRVDGRRVAGGENDGEAVLGRLVEASLGGLEALLGVLRGIEGPFAFVYYDAPTETLLFGRDRLGRRSLVMARDEGGGVTLCSVANGEGWREVEADGIYALRVGVVEVSRHEWVVGDDAADFVSILGAGGLLF